MGKDEENKGYVYLLGDWEKEGIFKIGVTKGTLERRIKKLQTGNSGEIFVCSAFQTKHPFFIEARLHDKYQSKKILNEWFELTNEEALNFKKTCQEIEDLISFMQENNPFFPKKIK